MSTNDSQESPDTSDTTSRRTTSSRTVRFLPFAVSLLATILVKPVGMALVRPGPSRNENFFSQGARLDRIAHLEGAFDIVTGFLLIVTVVLLVLGIKNRGDSAPIARPKAFVPVQLGLVPLALVFAGSILFHWVLGWAVDFAISGNLPGWSIHRLWPVIMALPFAFALRQRYRPVVSILIWVISSQFFSEALNAVAGGRVDIDLSRSGLIFLTWGMASSVLFMGSILFALDRFPSSPLGFMGIIAGVGLLTSLAFYPVLSLAIETGTSVFAELANQWAPILVRDFAFAFALWWGFAKIGAFAGPRATA